MQKLWLVIVLVLIPSTVWASIANVYIANSSAGGDTGTDCANAHAVSFFNTGANWGSGAAQIGAGTTVHLCGTISTALSAQGNGASGNPVIILFGPNARISMSPIPASGAIVLDNRSDITVDGGSTITCGYINPSNVPCNNGIIESLNNGTAGATRITSLAVSAQNSTRIEVRNLFIGPLYVHTADAAGLADTSSGATGTCVHFDGSTNLSVHNNTMHDTAWCLNGGGQGTHIFNNEIYNIDHGVGIGQGNYTDLLIHHNHFHDYGNWDTTSNTYHHDGIHLFNTQGSGSIQTDIYNNLFDGTFGNNVTSHVYLQGRTFPARVFNNVFVVDAGRFSNTGNLSFSGEGVLQTGNAAYNNTIIGSNHWSQGTCLGANGSTNLTIINSVIMGCDVEVGLDPGVTFASNGLNNNVYQNSSIDGTSTCVLWKQSNPCRTTLSAWQGDTGQDSAAILALASQIKLDSVKKPQLGSVAIGAGRNLTSLGITALNSDFLGVNRPSSGAWDAGAYQSGGGAPCSPVISSVTLNPTSVTGGTNSTGTVTISCAPSVDTVVSLSSNNTAAATVPFSVKVLANQTTANFTVMTVAVCLSTNVTIMATLGGSTTASLMVTAGGGQCQGANVIGTAKVMGTAVVQ